MSDYEHVRRLSERPPRVRASQTRNNSSSSKCCSNLFPWCLFQKISRKCCLNWLQLQMFQQIVRTNVNYQCQEHITHGPGLSIIVKHQKWKNSAPKDDDIHLISSSSFSIRNSNMEKHGWEICRCLWIIPA